MYKVIFTNEAQKNLDKLDKKYQSAVLKAIDKISQNPDLGKKLKDGFKGLSRIRFSRYRIVYEIKRNRLLVIVISIVHRKDVYR